MFRRTHDGRIDHGVFIVGIGRQGLQHALPDAALAPARVPDKYHMDTPEALRQIVPGNARPVAVQHRFDKQAVILGRRANMPVSTAQPMHDPRPLVEA